MCRINVNLPGQIGRRTVKLLIEEISPAANRLAQRQAGRGDIRPFNETENLILACEKIQGNQAAHNGTGDAQAALPNCQGIKRMCQIIVRGEPLSDG